MQPILCSAGYGVPLKAGRLEIVQVIAPGSDTNSSSRLTLIDDGALEDGDKFGNFVATKTSKHRLVFDKKRVAACHANIDEELAEPMKVIHGISVLNAENLVPGSIFVYIR